MVDSKFFGIPFAVSGDKATIPEDTQPSGAISYTQGYGPDYERDPETDPLAKRVPRDETNELYYQITNTIRFLQLYGTPEWYAVDDNGDPVSYPLTARVRYDAGSGMQAWRSLIASNTTVPGANPAHWTLDEPFSTAALEASIAEMFAGVTGSKLVTPRRAAAAIQSNTYLYAVAGGSANALTASLSPAPASLTVGMVVNIKIAAVNTSTTPTLNLNGFGASTIVANDGSSLPTSSFAPDLVATLSWDGTNWRLLSLTASQTPPRNIITYTTPGATNFIVPAGIYKVYARVWGGGGGGGGCIGPANVGGGGGGGEYREGWFDVVPGQIIPVTVGARGAAGIAANTGNAGTGGTSSFGSYITAIGGSGGSNGSATGGTGGNGGTGGSFTVNGGTGYTGGYFFGNTSFPFGGAGAPAYQQSLIMPSLAGGSVQGFGFGSGASGASGPGSTVGSLGAPGAVIVQY